MLIKISFGENIITADVRNTAKRPCLVSNIDLTLQKRQGFERRDLKFRPDMESHAENGIQFCFTTKIVIYYSENKYQIFICKIHILKGQKKTHNKKMSVTRKNLVFWKHSDIFYAKTHL